MIDLISYAQPSPETLPPPEFPADARELLSRFATTGEQEPFEEVVRRYGGMVYNLCYEVTGNRHDAEDAVQAAFMSLALQVRGGQQIQAIGPWLQQVARRMSLDINRSRKRRKKREDKHGEAWEARMTDARADGAGGAGSHGNPASAAGWEELRHIVQAELNEMPAKYRMPLILHYYGGMSRDEMARELNCKTNTLGVRLHRGREMLAKRLAKRGITLSGVMLGLIMGEVVHSVVSQRLIEHTAQAAVLVSSGHPFACGVVSPQIVALAHSAGRALANAKIKLAATLALMAGGAAAAGAQVVSHTTGGRWSVPAVNQWDVSRAFRWLFNPPSFPKKPLVKDTTPAPKPPTDSKIVVGPGLPGDPDAPLVRPPLPMPAFPPQPYRKEALTLNSFPGSTSQPLPKGLVYPPVLRTPQGDVSLPVPEEIAGKLHINRGFGTTGGGAGRRGGGQVNGAEITDDTEVVSGRRRSTPSVPVPDLQLQPQVQPHTETASGGPAGQSGGGDASPIDTPAETNPWKPIEVTKGSPKNNFVPIPLPPPRQETNETERQDGGTKPAPVPPRGVTPTPGTPQSSDKPKTPSAAPTSGEAPAAPGVTPTPGAKPAPGANPAPGVKPNDGRPLPPPTTMDPGEIVTPGRTPLPGDPKATPLDPSTLPPGPPTTPVVPPPGRPTGDATGTDNPTPAQPPTTTPNDSGTGVGGNPPPPTQLPPPRAQGGFLSDTGDLYVTSPFHPAGPETFEQLLTGTPGNARFQIGAGATLVSKHVLVGHLGSGVATQTGGLHTVDSLYVGVMKTGRGQYQMTGGELRVTTSPTGPDAPVHSIDVGGAGEGTFLLGDATSTGTIAQSGGGGGVNLNVGVTRSGKGTLRGWGQVQLTGLLTNNGKVVADGHGQDRTLDLTTFTAVANARANTIAGNGWYAYNHGKLELPAIPVTPTAPVATWGQGADSASLTYVNSARLTFKDVTTEGSVRIALLALDRTDLPALPQEHTFIGAWSLDTGTLAAAGGMDLLVRYDDVLATEKGLDENVLKLWRHVDGQWERLDGEVTFLRDALTHTLSVHTGIEGVTHFAVSAPEPGTVGMIIVAGGLWLGGRRRRR